MSPVIPTRLVIYGGAAFALGVVGGFGWALLRPHEMSQYRRSLSEAKTHE